MLQLTMNNFIDPMSKKNIQSKISSILLHIALIALYSFIYLISGHEAKNTEVKYKRGLQTLLPTYIILYEF